MPELMAPTAFPPQSGKTYWWGLRHLWPSVWGDCTTKVKQGKEVLWPSTAWCILQGLNRTKLENVASGSKNQSIQVIICIPTPKPYLNTTKTLKDRPYIFLRISSIVETSGVHLFTPPGWTKFTWLDLRQFFFLFVDEVSVPQPKPTTIPPYNFGVKIVFIGKNLLYSQFLLMKTFDFITLVLRQ